MALDRAEFLRCLPHALAGRPWQASGDGFVVDTAGGRVLIRLGPTGERRIAGLRLPSTPVELDFGTCSADAAHALLRDFARGFQRGGG